MARFINLVLALTLLFGVGLFTWQHLMHNFTPFRANRCAMTYFQADMTGLEHPHSFYEITKFNIHSPIIPSAHEFVTNNDATLKMAEKSSFSIPPSHPDDEMQHLLFFFPGNAGNRWQGRSLGTKIDMYIRQINEQFDSYTFSGVDRRNKHADPSLPAFPAKLSYLLGEALTPSNSFHSTKAYHPKYYQAESMASSTPDSTLKTNKTEWYNSGDDVIYRIDGLIDELVALNPSIETNDSIATIIQSNYINNNIYTFSFNEQASAASGLALQSQQEYAVASIVRLIEKTRREFFGKIRISLVGHSMGGIIALSAVDQLNAAIRHNTVQYKDTAIANVVTIGAPVVPLYIADYTHLHIYDSVTNFSQTHENCHLPSSDPLHTKDPLICNISVLHVDGGQGDELVPPAFTAVSQYRHFKHPKTVSATDLSTIRATSDHDCLAYCAQVMEAVAQSVLRRIVVDSIAVGKVLLKKTIPDERIAAGYTRPSVEYLPIPSNLQIGVIGTKGSVFEAKNRIEFNSLLTKTLPLAQVSTVPMRSQSPLLNLINDVIIGSEGIPHNINAVDEEKARIGVPIKPFSFFLKEIADFTQKYNTESLLTEQLPALTKSIPLSDLFESKDVDHGIVGISQVPLSIYLCPNEQNGQNNEKNDKNVKNVKKSIKNDKNISLPLHTCVDITTPLSQPIPTPELLFSIFRQPHTHRPSPDNGQYYLSRSSRKNHKEDKLAGDEGYILPHDLTTSQHGFSMFYDLEQLYSIAKKVGGKPDNVMNVSAGREFKEKWDKMVQNIEIFRTSFSLKAILTPPVLEGLLAIQDVASIDVDWARDVRIPLFWTTKVANGVQNGTEMDQNDKNVQNVKNTSDPLVSRYQLILADPTTPEPTPISPNGYECEVLSASLLNAIAFPIISVQVTTHTAPNQDRIVFISQTHQFAEKSPYTTACLLPPTQRLIQASEANAQIDIVTGHVFPRPRDHPVIPYVSNDEKKSLSISKHTTYGLLPVPSHLTGSIEDTVTVSAPPLKRPVGALPDKSPIVDSTVVLPVLLPENFTIPVICDSFKRISTAILTLLLPMLSLSLHFVLISVLYNVYSDNGKKRWMSVIMDQLDEKDAKNTTLQGKLLSKKKKSCFLRSTSSLFKYITAFIIALAITLFITLPIVLRSDERLQQRLAVVMGYLEPVMQIHEKFHLLMTPLKSHFQSQSTLILTSLQQNVLKHIPSEMFEMVSKADKVVAEAFGYVRDSWPMKIFVPVFYFFSHAASPVSAALKAPLSDAILTSQANISPLLALVEHVVTAGLYYTLAYIVSRVILGLLCVVTFIISIPHRLLNFITLTALPFPFPRSFGQFLTSFWTQFVFPLWLSMTYILPVTAIFVYSSLATLTIAINEQSGMGYFFVKLIKTICSESIAKLLLDSITSSFNFIHCYLKHGIYWMIHAGSKAIANHCNVAAKEPTKIVTFLKQFDKNHFVQKIALYLHRVFSDFASYTSTALSPNFKCFIHPKDYQLLPLPVTAASIIFITFIWTILFIIIVRYMTTYQFSFIDDYVNTFYNTKDSQASVDAYNAKVAANQQGNDDGLIQEETHHCNRLIERDVKASRRSVAKAFYALIVAAVFMVFLILPSTHVVTDVSALSLKEVQYRELYLGLQGANPTPGSYVPNSLLTAEQFQLKLERESIDKEQFFLHGQDTVSFSIFYTLLNMHPHNALTPSQIHNIFAKVMLTAQWYQQRGAWIPTVPVDMFTAVNTSTSLAFTLLLLIQLITALSYFIQVNNAKHRILDIARAAKETVEDKDSTEQRNLRQRAIHLDPSMINFATTIVSITTSLISMILSLLVFAPYLLPLFNSLSVDIDTDLISQYLPSLGAVQTPYHQSKVPMVMMIFALIWTVMNGLTYKLVIPNEVDRPYKENRVA